MQPTPFFPQSIFSPGQSSAITRVFTSPGKYIQGPGVLSKTGTYLSLYDITRLGIIASARGHSSEGEIIEQSLQSQGIKTVKAVFRGECSLDQIERLASEFKSARLDAILVLGGGKCVDAGKCVAFRLGLPIIVAPTLASNDAPCSAVSVLYTPEGVSSGVEFFPHNPVMVIVDTLVVAAASERYLVAGMGDAMATKYEAQVCIDNPLATNVLGARPTLAACALGDICASTLYEDGVAAATAVRQGTCNHQLERVVEANTLLSGLGFESGGLAAAHGFAQGYTVLPEVEHNYLHGEMVAMGLLAQLILQSNKSEALKVAEFFAKVGLPVSLAQLGLSATKAGPLNTVLDATIDFAFLSNLPFQVSLEDLRAAILGANRIGESVIKNTGDQAYRRLQAL